MRTKKTSIGTTFIYNKKKGESDTEALTREFNSLKNSYSSKCRYLQYNYWRYSDAKKHFFAECKRISEILSFLRLKDKEVRDIVGDVLIYLGFPKSLDEFVKKFPTGYEITFVDSYDRYKDEPIYKITNIEMKVIINHDSLQPDIKFIETYSYSSNKQGGSKVSRFEFSNEGYEEILQKIKCYNED